MKKDQPCKPWTKDQELALLQGAGANGLVWIKKHTGNRNKDQVYGKLNAMGLSGGLTRGNYSLKAACRETGYNNSQLKRARDVLRQKWKKTSKNGRYFITEDQLEELTDWLALDYWSIKHSLFKCVWCHKREYRHKAFGLCEMCFNEYRRIAHELGIKQSFISVKEYIKSKCDESEMEQLDKWLDKGVMFPVEFLK